MRIDSKINEQKKIALNLTRS